jgi:hypothetical protein
MVDINIQMRKMRPAVASRTSSVFGILVKRKCKVEVP